MLISKEYYHKKEGHLIMKKTIYLANMIFTYNLFALDINGAIEYSLFNNNMIKESVEIIEEKRELVNSSKSVYKPKLNVKYTVDNKFEKNQEENTHDSELNVDLTYNLFNGFIDENTIKNSDHNFDISKYDYETAKYDLILKTKQDFISYLQAQKNTHVQQSALKLFQKQYDDAKNFCDNGVNITLNNLLEVEITLLESKKLLQEAISNEKIAKQKLLNTMGVITDEKINDIPLEEGKDPKYLNKRPIINNIALSKLEKYKNILINEKNILKGNYYPKIDVTLQHKQYGNNLSLNEREGSAKPQNIALLGLTWNLYNGNKDKSNIVAYKHKINQINYQIEQLKQDLDLSYSEAKEQLILATQNLQISKKTFKQAKVNYKIVNNSFKEGIVTSKELIDANYLLSKSEASYHDSYYTKLLAIATIERILEINKK